MHARNANTTQRPGRSLSHPESVESDEGKTTKGTEEGGGGKWRFCMFSDGGSSLPAVSTGALRERRLPRQPPPHPGNIESEA